MIDAYCDYDYGLFLAARGEWRNTLLSRAGDAYYLQNL